MALARALAIEPRVLLLDEPFGALDAVVRQELRQWVKVLHEQIHVTTVLVTHDQQEAMEVADQLIVMRAGHVIQSGNPLALYESPSTDFVHEFLGPSTIFEGVVTRPHDLELVSVYDGAMKGRITSIVSLGFEAQVTVELDDRIDDVGATQPQRALPDGTSCGAASRRSPARRRRLTRLSSSRQRGWCRAATR